MHISSSFDSGAIDVVDATVPGDIQLRIRSDNAAEFAQWFHFRLQDAKDLGVCLRFLNAGACAYPKGWENYRVVASYDRKNWFRIETTYDGAVMAAQMTPEAQSVYFAYFEPYSYERHLDLIGTAAKCEHVAIVCLGQTVEARDMNLLRITNAGSKTPEGQKKKIWLIARQHPGESMAEWFAEGFLERLIDQDDSVSRTLLEECIFYVVPNMNPDGAVRGNLRTNAAGVNLNREWQSPTVEKSPEVFLVRTAMLQTGVDMFLDAHGDEGLPYNFVVGSEGTASYSPRRAGLEDRFKSAWVASCPDFQTRHGYDKSRPSTGNLSLATNWVAQQFDCLAFTIEMPFKDNADLPNPLTGWSAERSKRLGASVRIPLLTVIDELRQVSQA